jgi:protein required for attachment to host cells
MLIPHGTIVAIVDGAHFALLRNSGDEAEPVLEAHVMPVIDLHGHASGGQHGHLSGHDPASQVIEAQHSGAVVQWLNHEVLEHRLTDLIIIASPRTLGELRPHYHGQLKQILRCELAKDMAGRTGTEVLAVLRA